MEIFALLLGLAVLFGLARLFGKNAASTPQPKRPKPSAGGSKPPPKPFDARSARPVPGKKVLSGPAYVVDGDTLTINKTQIRLFGVDAPELDHPYGQKAKWAMVKLCKGKTIRAEITEIDAHGRTVARCYLPDGRDLSAEMVKQGMAIDWPKYSGGTYRSMEPQGVRKRLWLADARQKGRMDVWARFEAEQNRKP